MQNQRMTSIIIESTLLPVKPFLSKSLPLASMHPPRKGEDEFLSWTLPSAALSNPTFSDSAQSLPAWVKKEPECLVSKIKVINKSSYYICLIAFFLLCQSSVLYYLFSLIHLFNKYWLGISYVQCTIS